MEPEVMYTIFRRSHETPCAFASPSRAAWISESQRGANILSRAFQAAWNVLRNINLCSVNRQIKKWSLWRVVRILSNVELVHWKKGLPKKEKKKCRHFARIKYMALAVWSYSAQQGNWYKRLAKCWSVLRWQNYCLQSPWVQHEPAAAREEGFVKPLVLCVSCNWLYLSRYYKKERSSEIIRPINKK